MSPLYEELKEQLQDYISYDFPKHHFDEDKITLTDANDETYQARYDISDTVMVFIEREGPHAWEKWHIETATEEYTDEEYTEMFESHFSSGLDEFKDLYKDDWKKVALECAFENREL